MLLSAEEKRQIRESRLIEETEHDYKYVYVLSLVDNEACTISHVYHKVCVNGLCRNKSGGYFIAKSQPTTAEEISALKKTHVAYYDSNIKIELLDEIDIAGEYNNSTLPQVKHHCSAFS